jgi:hypothetical protein
MKGMLPKVRSVILALIVWCGLGSIPVPEILRFWAYAFSGFMI